MAESIKRVLVIGGTGGQGRPVVHELAKDGRYEVTVLTRNDKSPEALELAQAYHKISFFVGDLFDEKNLRDAFTGVDAAFVNTNGFLIGEAKEVYWGIRIYEIARGLGVKHFIYSGLDYSSEIHGYDPLYRCGHLDAKGKVVAFLKSQPIDPMGWSVISSGPYLEGLASSWAPYHDTETDTWIFDLPLGKAGSLPLISLTDFGRYVRWQLDNPSKSRGQILRVSTQHATGEGLASTFTEVTGKRAIYKPVEMEEYFQTAFSRNVGAPLNRLVGAGQPDTSTLQTYEENFSGFWRHWAAGEKYSVRDYKTLDEILPDRIRSVGEWMRLSGWKGEKKMILKENADRQRASTAAK